MVPLPPASLHSSQTTSAPSTLSSTDAMPGDDLISFQHDKKPSVLTYVSSAQPNHRTHFRQQAEKTCR